MEPLEIAATAFTLISVILAVKRNLWQFPSGIIGTGLGFFVFRDAQLYASAALQPVFLAALAYGWWYWLKGEKGGRPPIRSMRLWQVLGSCLAALAVAAAGAWALDTFTNAQMALADASIFGLSVVAQILLDRKRIENWPVWIVINALSVYVYSTQGLWLYAGLYVLFIFTAFWGWREWRKAMTRQPPGQPPGSP